MHHYALYVLLKLFLSLLPAQLVAGLGRNPADSDRQVCSPHVGPETCSLTHSLQRFFHSYISPDT